MSVGLIVGSFDPIIVGQVDLIERAAKLCERVVVAVESTSAHETLFTSNERLDRINSAFAELPTVEVRAHSGDLARLVLESAATVYLVALRNRADVERVLVEIQPQCVELGIELMALLAEPAHAFVTTALVRDVARLGGDISPFVPE